MRQPGLNCLKQVNPIPQKKLDIRGKIIAFDADDTLWHNEINFRNAEREFAQAMLPFCNPEEAVAHLMAVEGRNIPTLGYGTKTFIIALAEAAMELGGENMPNSKIREVIEIGKKTVCPQVELYPYAKEVLEMLHKEQSAYGYRLVLATKGDLKDQQYKIDKSGLQEYFSHIEIMPEKDRVGYSALMQKCGVQPQDFIMVGNSFKSDIKPVLELGGSAVYIPSKIIWVHEVVEEFDHQNLVRLESIKEVPQIFGFKGL